MPQATESPDAGNLPRPEVHTAGSSQPRQVIRPDKSLPQPPPKPPTELEASLQLATPATPVFGVGSRPWQWSSGEDGLHQSCRAEDNESAKVLSDSSEAPSWFGQECRKDGARRAARPGAAKPSLGSRNREGIEIQMQADIGPTPSAPSTACSSSSRAREGQKPQRPWPAKRAVRVVERAVRTQSRCALRWCLTAWHHAAAAHTATAAHSSQPETLRMFTEVLEHQDRMDEMTANKVLEQWKECQILQSELSVYDRQLQLHLEGDAHRELASELAAAQAEVTQARLAEAQTAQAELSVLRAVRSEVVSERQAERAQYRAESSQLRCASSELAELQAAVENLESQQRASASQEAKLEELEASELQSAKCEQERDKWAEHCSALSDELRMQGIICRRLELDETEQRRLRGEESSAAQRLGDAVLLLEESDARLRQEEFEQGEVQQQLQLEIHQLKMLEGTKSEELQQAQYALADATQEYNLARSERDTELERSRLQAISHLQTSSNREMCHDSMEAGMHTSDYRLRFYSEVAYRTVSLAQKRLRWWACLPCVVRLGIFKTTN